MPFTDSSSVAHFSCPQSFPALGSFLMSQLFASDGQNVGVSASASALLVNIQGWFPLGLTGLISLLSGGTLKSSPSPQFESINSLALSLLHGPPFTALQDSWKNYSFEGMLLTNVEGPGDNDRTMPWTFLDSFLKNWFSEIWRWHDKAQRNDILRRKKREGVSLFLKRQLVNRRNQSHSN